jgi:predicted deacetylase
MAPRASVNKDFLHDLEQTMSLLVFSADSLSPQIAALLKPELRRQVADRVNQAILKRQGSHVEARIKEWVRARTWAEQYARKTKKDIPARIPIGLDGDDEAESEEDMNGDAMVT